MSNLTFDLESDMTSIVTEWLQEEGYTVWPEAPMGYEGNNPPYADIAGARLIEERCREREENGPVTPWGSPKKCKRRMMEPMLSWYPLFEITVAVELKLNRWEEAMGQGVNYLHAFLEGYVAFPMEKATWVMDKVQECPDDVDVPYVVLEDNAAPLGILGVGDGHVEVLREPSPVNPYWEIARVINLAERARRHWREELK